MAGRHFLEGRTQMAVAARNDNCTGFVRTCAVMVTRTTIAAALTDLAGRKINKLELALQLNK
jgi:hypothetical protein